MEKNRKTGIVVLTVQLAWLSSVYTIMTSIKMKLEDSSLINEYYEKNTAT